MNSLDNKSIDSFLHVTGSLSNSSSGNISSTTGSNPHDSAEVDTSRIEPALKESKNIRLILRSNGHEFPAKKSTNAVADDNNPAYLVCLAHHVPSDQFILFVFNSTTMPCRLIRYDRDGNMIEKKKKKSLYFNAIDAAALVAAVNTCHEGNDAYFGSTCTIDDDDYSPGECLRLVPSTKDSETDTEDYEAIRKVILTELLCTDRGDDGLQFQHPDPNFLLPLSRSISEELKCWRYLRQYHLTYRTGWPELPSRSEWEKAIREEVGQRMSAKEKEVFDRIVQGRSVQVEKSVQKCLSSMKKMESFLRTLSGESNSATISSISYLLGKEIVASLALLRHRQQMNPNDWVNFHHTLESDGQDSYQYAMFLGTWLENTNNAPQSTNNSDGDNCRYDAEIYTFDAGDGVNEVVHRLHGLWAAEEEALLEALGRVVTTVEHCLTPGNEQCFESVFDCIKSEQEFVSSLQMNSKRVTEMNAARLVELTSDGDEELKNETSWLRDATWPTWTSRDLEAHLSFGWYMLESENSSGLTFVVDHKGLMTCLRDQRDIRVTSTPSQSIRRREFERWWEIYVDPIVNITLKAIERLLAIGDLLNSSIAILCLLGVFCDGALLGKVRIKWYNYDVEKDDNETFIIPKFQEVWRKCDALATKVALAYFETERSHRQIGSDWFFHALKSGLVYSPKNASDIYFRLANDEKIKLADRLEACWPRYSHPAASIFLHHGWQHPIFLSILDLKDNEKEVLLPLQKLEAPVVIKGRFNLMKEQGNNPVAIALARVAGGDHECMHFLLTNGLTSEAMVQASIHKNFDGLVRLSDDLVLTNPCASVLCIQAHILGRIEESDSDNRLVCNAIDHLVHVLGKAWSTGEQADQCDVPGRVLSLRLLSTLSLARIFLRAAKSTSEMQAILELHLAQSGIISPFLATIAITSRATRQESFQDCYIKYFLSKTDLLSVCVQKSELDVLVAFIKGSLTDFENVPEGFSRKNYLDLICFLYESAKFLIEVECCRSIFCFTVALFTSVQIGVRTGCEAFAVDVIGSLKEVEKDHFDFEQNKLSSHLSNLCACFSALFSSCGYDVCQSIQHALLETFMEVKLKLPDTSYNDRIASLFDEVNDAHHSQVWMAVAYSKVHGTKAAGAALSDHIISNYTELDETILESLRILAEVDANNGDNEATEERSSKKLNMHPFVNSDKRKHVTEVERNEMISTFISQTLGSAPFLAHKTIDELYRRLIAIDPLVFNPGLEEVETRASHMPDLTLALSKKSCLFTTCTLMHYTEDNPYMALDVGLRWLRNALSSKESFILFDNFEPLSNFVDMKRDKAGTYRRFFPSIAYQLEGRPKLAARALVAVLDANIMGMLEGIPPPWLSDLCNEALVLCRALDVLIEPTLKSVGALDKAWSNSSPQLRKNKLPSFLQPKVLTSIVVDPQWSAEPDFSAKHKERSYTFNDEPEDDSPLVPFLDHRVAIAVEYGYMKKATQLCITTMNYEFWTKLSNESTRKSHNKNTMTKVRRVVSACLHIINGAIPRREDLSGDFVNHVLHLVLAMNWFRACKKCSPKSPFVNEHAQEFVVSLDHVAKVHEIAMAWGDLLDETKSPFGPSLRHCLDIFRCISRCIHVLEGGDFKRRIDCSKCCSFRQDRSEEDTSSSQEEISRPIKKQKLLESSIDADFKELEAFAQQLAMKDATNWCKDAIRRLEIEESNEK